MADTSYNPTFAPFPNWSARQAPVPQTTHNLPATIAANSSVSTSLIVTEGYSLISASITSTQAGTLSVQRYLDAGGTVAQGSPTQVSFTANTAANLDVLDGKPFASFMLTVTNSAGSAATLSNFALLLQIGQNTSTGASATGAALDGTDATGVTAPSGGVGIRGWLSGIYGKLIGQVKVIVTDPTSGNGALVQAFHNSDNQSLGTSYGIMTGGVDQLVNGAGNLDRKRSVSGDAMAATGLAAEVPMIWNGSSYDRAPGSASLGAKVYLGQTATDGSTTITTGGTAQNLFGGSTPTNGFAIYNPDPSNDLWASDSGTAIANGQGCIRIAANGGGYETPPGYKPLGAISIVGATTGQKITARRW